MGSVRNPPNGNAEEFLGLETIGTFKTSGTIGTAIFIELND